MCGYTFPLDGVVGALPFEAHGLEELIREVKLYLLAPRDDVDQSEDGIVEIVDAQGIDGERCGQIFGVVDKVDDAGEDGEVEGEGGGKEQQPARGEHCRQL